MQTKQVVRRFGASIEASMRIERARRGLSDVSQKEIDRLDRASTAMAKRSRKAGVTLLDFARGVR